MTKLFTGDQPSGGKGVRLLDVKPGQCKWPLGKYLSVATMYCGDPISAKSSVYCECHRLRARTPFRAGAKP